MDHRPQVLRLDPSTELTFNGNKGTPGKAAFTEIVTTKLHLDNPSDRIVYFKVKTTAPKVYCVRPNSGILKPGASAEINVSLQPVVEPPVLMREGLRHKFMIQSAFAPNEKAPIDEYFKSLTPADIMDTKLRVAFNMGDRGSGETIPAGRGSGESVNTSGHGGADSFSSAVVSLQQNASTQASVAPAPLGEKNDNTELRRRHDTELKKMETENRKLQDELNLLQQQLKSTTITTGEGMPTIHVALLAIAMLLLGIIMGKVI